jgi:hypothetical protein
VGSCPNDSLTELEIPRWTLIDTFVPPGRVPDPDGEGRWLEYASDHRTFYFADEDLARLARLNFLERVKVAFD